MYKPNCFIENMGVVLNIVVFSLKIQAFWRFIGVKMNVRLFTGIDGTAH